MTQLKRKIAKATLDAADDSGPRMRRWEEQRWVIDNIIRTVGIEWDQPRMGNYASACGPAAAGDIAAIRARVQKYTDITPAFEAVARRREAAAREAEAENHGVTARDNYFCAAVFWAASQWTLLNNNNHNHDNNTRKRECFLGYARHADHRVEAAWIDLPGGKRMPGWLHLPYAYRSGRVPAVVSIPGMDGFKESNVALLGDRWLSRGIAVLVIDGPGQYESALHDLYFSVPAWKAAGKAAYEWLARRAEIDADRIGIIGNSFGSYFATIAAAWEPRFGAVAVSSICFEPGGGTIFDQASPTFKRRFMYMAGFTDEARFDRFRRALDSLGGLGRIAGLTRLVHEPVLHPVGDQGLRIGTEHGRGHVAHGMARLLVDDQLLRPAHRIQRTPGPLDRAQLVAFAGDAQIGRADTRGVLL